MNKPEITQALAEKHQEFCSYILSLSEEEYHFHPEGKWSAEGHLEHMLLCVKPILMAFSMDKDALAKQFGTLDGKGRSPQELSSIYRQKVEEGGKAPQRFVSQESTHEERSMMCEKLNQLVAALCLKLDVYGEEELDHYSIPHPLLGQLSLREMLYNMIGHVQVHQRAIARDLQIAAS
jgi:hypothetical protein